MHPARYRPRMLLQTAGRRLEGIRAPTETSQTDPSLARRPNGPAAHWARTCRREGPGAAGTARGAAVGACEEQIGQRSTARRAGGKDEINRTGRGVTPKLRPYPLSHTKPPSPPTTADTHNSPVLSPSPQASAHPTTHLSISHALSILHAHPLLTNGPRRAPPRTCSV